MNIQKLMEYQRGLDIHIEEEKGLKSYEHKDEKILALFVEVGELANEWRGFKFWSKDQEPRTRIVKYKDGVKVEYTNLKNPLLEEYADCLSFILSIGNDLGVNVSLQRLHYRYEKNITKQFNRLFMEISDFSIARSNVHYFRILNVFLALGEMLGFSLKEIEQAYLKKNVENHQRQMRGY